MTRFLMIGLALLVSVPGCSDDGNKLPTPKPEQGLRDPVGRSPDGFFDLAMTVNPTFPDQTVLDNTKQILMIMRESPSTGDGCDALWSSTPFAGREGGTTFVWPATGSNALLSPIATGGFDLLFYALDSSFDLLCQTDEWCATSQNGPHCTPLVAGYSACSATAGQPAATPVAGGCASAVFKVGGIPALSFNLAAPPPAQ